MGLQLSCKGHRNEHTPFLTQSCCSPFGWLMVNLPLLYSRSSYSDTRYGSSILSGNALVALFVFFSRSTCTCNGRKGWHLVAFRTYFMSSSSLLHTYTNNNTLNQKPHTAARRETLTRGSSKATRRATHAYPRDAKKHCAVRKNRAGVSGADVTEEELLGGLLGSTVDLTRCVFNCVGGGREGRMENGEKVTNLITLSSGPLPTDYRLFPVPEDLAET